MHEVETDEEFDLVVETAGDKLLSVDFYATWCGIPF